MMGTKGCKGKPIEAGREAWNKALQKLFDRGLFIEDLN